MFTSAFLKATAERAAKTFLQTYFATFLVGDAVLNVFEFSWGGPELGISLGAAALSLVTSLLSASVGNPGPSLTTETTVLATLGHNPSGNL